MVTVEFERGLPTLLIPEGATGKLRRYSLEIQQTPKEWVATLSRLDTDKVYEIFFRADGVWSCSCPDAKYRPAERSDSGCKHIKHLREVREFAAYIIGGEQDVVEVMREARLMFETQPV